MYCISRKLSKRDKLGIHAIIEMECVATLALAVDSAFKPHGRKLESLENLRLKIEILKHLVRSEYELEIIDTKTYLRLSEQMVEISKMTNGWLNFVTQKGA